MKDTKGNTEKIQKEQAVKIQQRYMEYQMLEQQLKGLQEQLQNADKQRHEAKAVKQSLDDFNEAKVGDEVLVPVSGGIFFKTELKETDKFLVNVGSNVIVEKDLKSVKALVDEQVKEIEEFYEKVMTEFTKLALKYNELEEELKKMVE